MPFSTLEAHCDSIEECYEYMLAFAAQGVEGNEGGASGGQLRHLLIAAVNALQNLGDAMATAVKEENLQPAIRYEAFQKVLERDAADSLATLELVLAQPRISSQLIDNLNASMHLRALLTDLFLIDEIARIHTQSKVALGVNSADSLLQTISSNND